MELNDGNLQTLTEFMRKTLDPDQSVRRPGMGAQSRMHVHLKHPCALISHGMNMHTLGILYNFPLLDWNVLISLISSS